MQLTPAVIEHVIIHPPSRLHYALYPVRVSIVSVCPVSTIN